MKEEEEGPFGFNIDRFIQNSIGKKIEVFYGEVRFTGKLKQYRKVDGKDIFLLVVTVKDAWFVDGNIRSKRDPNAAASGKEDITKIIPYDPLTDVFKRIDERRFND